MSWSLEQDARLKSLFRQNLSASQIAVELGCGLSRNAVIGRIHRLGLSGKRSRLRSSGLAQCAARIGRNSRDDAELKRRIENRQSARQADRPKPKNTRASALDETFGMVADGVIDLPADYSPDAVTFADLRFYQCRWPMGDPRTAEFLFCGSACADGFVYCNRHARIAYTKAPAIGSEERFRRQLHGRRIEAENRAKFHGATSHAKGP
jgi:GcrA cell cycle regulator